MCNITDCLLLLYYWSNVLGIIYGYTCTNLYIYIDLLMGFYKIIIRHSICGILFVIIQLIYFILFLDSLAIPLFLVLIVMEIIQFVILFIKFVHHIHLIIFILNSLFMVISPNPQVISLFLANSYIFLFQYCLWKFLIYHSSLSPSHSI